VVLGGLVGVGFLLAYYRDRRRKSSAEPAPQPAPKPAPPPSEPAPPPEPLPAPTPPATEVEKPLEEGKPQTPTENAPPPVESIFRFEECECTLENMRLEVSPSPYQEKTEDGDFTLSEGVQLVLLIEGNVLTNRKPGILNISVSFNVMFMARLPNGGTISDSAERGPMNLVPDMSCQKGGKIFFTDSDTRFEIFEFDPHKRDVLNGHGINLPTTLDAEVEIQGHVEGCDPGWSFDETKKFRIEIADLGEQLYFLPSVKAILPPNEGK